MQERLERRRLLSVAGAGVVAAIAGCTTPSSSTPQGNPTETVSVDADEQSQADETVYSEVYEATIDAVTLVQTFGDGGFGGPGEGSGSGFVYDDRYIVTNDHVVFGGENVDVEVQYTDGSETETTVLGSDFYSDLAVLEPDHIPSDVTPLAFSDDQPVVGQEVLAIGNPVGLEGSLSQGIVSGVNRAISPGWHDFSFPNVVQTDAAVNPGSSGGPLVDLAGEVVGVVHATQGENIGFAISSALSQRVVPSLIQTGQFRHSHMGVRITPVTQTIAEANDLPEATGLVVVEVVEDGPAAGVLEESDDVTGDGIPVGGDVILEIDGESIPDDHALSTFLALETDPGDEIEITVYRDEEETTIELTLEERPEPEPGDFMG